MGPSDTRCRIIRLRTQKRTTILTTWSARRSILQESCAREPSRWTAELASDMVARSRFDTVLIVQRDEIPTQKMASCFCIFEFWSPPDISRLEQNSSSSSEAAWLQVPLEAAARLCQDLPVLMV